MRRICNITFLKPITLTDFQRSYMYHLCKLQWHAQVLSCWSASKHMRIHAWLHLQGHGRMSLAVIHNLMNMTHSFELSLKFGISSEKCSKIWTLKVLQIIMMWRPLLFIIKLSLFVQTWLTLDSALFAILLSYNWVISQQHPTSWFHEKVATWRIRC